MNTFNQLKIVAGSLLIAALLVSVAQAGETHTVTARSTSYDPMVLEIEPGDEVKWVNMGGH